MNVRRLVFLALPLLAACSAESSDGDASSTDSAVSSSQRDPVIVQAKGARTIGEESTGYLGIVDEKASDDVRAHVADINIKRRALYTDLAERDHVTVQDVAHATACLLFREHVAIGEAYRREDGTWSVRTKEAAPALPSFCEEH